MATAWTVASIQAIYDAITAANRHLPSAQAINFETHVKISELLLRELRGIEPDEGPADGKTIAERLAEVVATIGDLRVYDHAGCFLGVPTNGQRVYFYIAARAFTIPADFAGSQSAAVVAPTATAAFAINRNGLPVGTMTFAAGVPAAVFSSSGVAMEFLPGDKIDIVGPDPADATLDTLTWTFKILYDEEVE